jgi:hypothetical protein
MFVRFAGLTGLCGSDVLAHLSQDGLTCSEKMLNGCRRLGVIYRQAKGTPHLNEAYRRELVAVLDAPGYR